MEIRQTDLSEPATHELLRLHHEEMIAYSPPGTAHVLDIDALKVSEISVYAAWEGDQLLGLGAIKRHSDYAEIKSMRTCASALGRGVGRAILACLLDHARKAGFRLVRLETGTSELFDAANHLYQSEGFKQCDAFAGYPPTAFNRFYEMEV